MAQYQELDPVEAEAFIDAKGEYERRLAELQDAGEGDEVSVTSGDPDDHPVPEAAAEPVIQPASDLRPVMLCGLCRDGAGGECHTPGCALWMNRAPDAPVTHMGD